GQVRVGRQAAGQDGFAQAEVKHALARHGLGQGWGEQPVEFHRGSIQACFRGATQGTTIGLPWCDRKPWSHLVMSRSHAPSPRTRIRRLPERAHYDAATMAAIVDAAMICTVAFQIDGEVHAIPTIHWREGEHLYIHGAKASRMLKALTAGEACVTIALADGLVLARSAMHHSMNYRSVVIYGRFEPVTDPAYKLAS